MTQLNVLKDTEGFWITVGHYQDRDWVYSDNKQLIWSPQEGFVDELVIKGEGKPLKIKREHFQKRPVSTQYFHTDEYNVNRFFGDKNWIHQTINYYKKHPLSSPDDYYSLGRAHSSKSAQYILEYDHNQLVHQTPELVDSLVENGNLAVQYFKKVHELAPDFKTVIGSIYTKYCNEILTLNMRLAFLGLKQKALATVEGQELYPPQTRALSRNTLLSCPQNALLFTAGDNDTYSLLYLQQAKKIRTDVLIVNESLLNADYYAKHLSDTIYYTNKHLKVGLDAQHYQAPKNDYILLEKNTEVAAQPVKELIQLLASEGEAIKTASTNRFVLGNDEEAPELVCTNNYLSRSEILLLAILESNYKTRPIVFAPSYKPRPLSNNFVSNTGASQYIHTQGINQLFEYQEVAKNSLNKEQALLNYQLFTQEFKWPVFEVVQLEDFPRFHVVIMSFIETTERLIEQGEISKAQKLQNNWYKYFAETMDDMFVGQIDIIKQFFQTEQKKKGKQLLKQYIEHLQQGNFEGYELIHINKEILPKIRELIATYQLTEFSKEIRNLRD
jgi:hypothetical protein